MSPPLTLIVPLTRLHCHDGIASHLASLLPRLQRMGVRIFTAAGFLDTPAGSESTLRRIQEASEAFYVDERLRMHGKRLTICALYKQMRAIRALAARGNISLRSRHCIVHLQGRALAPAVRLSTGRRRAIVFTSHLGLGLRSVDAGYKQRFQAWVMADRVIAISSELARELSECEGHPKAVVRRIFHGVDRAHFKPPLPIERTKARELLGISADFFVVGMIARIATVKRHDTLIEAFKTIVRQGRKVHLVVAGEGDAGLIEELQQRLQPNDLADNSSYLGYADPRSVIWACDATVLPSEREGFPNSICESMACGVVPLRTPVEGALDQIDDGRTGFLFPIGDAEKLAALLMRLMDHPNERTAMSEAAAQFAAEHFSADVMAEKTLAVYRELSDDAPPDVRTLLP